MPLVVKGDVQGSIEAIEGALEKLGTDEVGARVIHSGVGGITESDVALAGASKGVIIGFNVRASREAREAAERDGIEIRYYNIIYNLVDDVKRRWQAYCRQNFREERNARQCGKEILEVFDVSKWAKLLVAASRMQSGACAGVRLIRDSVVIHEGKLATLRRFKDDVKESAKRTRMRMSFENYQDIRKGDIIECYRTHEVARTL